MSCTKAVDFNQVNDFKITPVFESSLVYLNEPASRFLVKGNEINIVKDSVNIDFFNNQFNADHLVKAEFLFETTNSINRAFQVQVDMFDINNQLQHAFTFTTDASPSNSDVKNEHIEVFEGNALTALLNSSKFVFTLYILPGVPIDNTTVGSIILRSKAAFYLSITNKL
ncbi:hypothetical protein [Yeosuana sp.]|uniref:hypothetical protein n=1 Tax=Yeosuana sp. TaxID=2529388 RepID=UPI004054B82A